MYLYEITWDDGVQPLQKTVWPSDYPATLDEVWRDICGLYQVGTYVSITNLDTQDSRVFLKMEE